MAWTEIRQLCEKKLASGSEFVTVEAKRLLQVEQELAGRWIPVEERLPEDGFGFVLICVHEHGYQVPNITMGRYEHDGDRQGWYDRWGWKKIGCKVLAWRPLPAPVEQGGKDG